MTEQELRKKIYDIMTRVWDDTYFPCTRDIIIKRMADALLVAEIGDVSEYKHRAKVAERALINALKCVDCKNCLYKNTQYLSIDNCYDRFLLEAEKELQEE